MVYATSLSESEHTKRWKRILEYFGPNIQYVAGVDNTVSDTISILPSTSVGKYEPSTKKAQCRSNELFEISRTENNEDYFPLDLLNVQREQQKYPIKINSKLSTYISDQGSG